MVTAPNEADLLGSRLTIYAFEAVISAVHQSEINDPIVYVAAAVYFIGNLVLPSKTSLYLASGAVLCFTGGPQDYTR